MDDEGVPLAVLEAWSFGGAELAPFERGLINRHWLGRRGGETLVFRRYNAARTTDAIAWEQQVIAYLAARSWPVANPVATRTGEMTLRHEGRWWSAAPYLGGDADLEPGVQSFRRQGELLARLHRDLAEAPMTRQRPAFGTSVELDPWVEATAGEPLQPILSAFEREHEELGRLMRSRLAENRAELAALGYERLPRQPVHGDFRDFNLLWTGNALTGLLDFDFTRLDAAIADFGAVLVPFMPVEVRRARAALEGYQSVRPLSPEEYNLLPAVARAALLWWVGMLLAGWRNGNMIVLGGITRTLTVRLPAVDAWEPEFRATTS